MQTVSSGLRSWSVVSALALAGCATLPPTPMESRSASVEGVSYASLDEAVQALAEDSPNGRTPRVHLYVPSTTAAISRYVDAQIRVDEDAYVIVLAVDLDHRVRVLYPEDPSDLGFVSKSQTQHMSRFFTGFGGIAGSSYYYSAYGSVSASRYRRGAVFALASDRPFQLDRIVDKDGDWNEDALSRILFTSNTSYSLGVALTMTGQHFTSDESTFAGSQGFTSLASQSFSGCGYGDSFYDSGFQNPYDTFGFSRPLVQYFVRGGTLYASYLDTNGCGRFYTTPIPIGPATDPRAPGDTTTKRDSSGTPVNAMRIAARANAERENSLKRGGADESVGRRVGGVRAPRPVDGQQPGEEQRNTTGFRYRPADRVTDRPERGSDTHERPIARPADGEHRIWQSRDRQSPSPNGEARAANPQARAADSSPRPERARAEPSRSEPSRSEPLHTQPAAAPAASAATPVAASKP
jgi:hypothetical protein